MVLLGTGGTLALATLQRHWSHLDRLEELRRAAENSRVESDAAVLRIIKPMIDTLEHEWNRLGGGPGPQNGAVGIPGKEFLDAFASLEKQFYHASCIDTEIQSILSDIYWCTRNFATSTGLLQMWLDQPTSKEATDGIKENQEARKEQTGCFRRLYGALNDIIATRIGINRITV